MTHPQSSNCLDIEIAWPTRFLMSRHLRSIVVRIRRGGGQPCRTRWTASWRPGPASGPTSTSRPLEVLSRVTRLARHLDRARRAAFAAHDLEVGVRRARPRCAGPGAPYVLSPGQLLAQTMVTSGTMTNRVDRLERRGLVQRMPDPADRRGVHRPADPRRRDRVDAALADLLARERDLLGRAAGAGSGHALRPAAPARRALRRRPLTRLTRRAASGGDEAALAQHRHDGEASTSLASRTSSAKPRSRARAGRQCSNGRSARNAARRPLPPARARRPVAAAQPGDDRARADQVLVRRAQRPVRPTARRPARARSGRRGGEVARPPQRRCAGRRRHRARRR